jgi:hypothetical protein
MLNDTTDYKGKTLITPLANKEKNVSKLCIVLKQKKCFKSDSDTGYRYNHNIKLFKPELKIYLYLFPHSYVAYELSFI